MYDNLENLKKIVRTISADYIIEVSMNNVARATLECYIPQVILEKDLFGVEKYSNYIDKRGNLVTEFSVSLDAQI